MPAIFRVKQTCYDNRKNKIGNNIYCVSIYQLIFLRPADYKYTLTEGDLELGVGVVTGTVITYIFKLFKRRLYDVFI